MLLMAMLGIRSKSKNFTKNSRESQQIYVAASYPGNIFSNNGSPT